MWQPFSKPFFQWPIPQHIMDNIPPYLDQSSPFTLGVTDVFAEIEIQGIKVRLVFSYFIFINPTNWL